MARESLSIHGSNIADEKHKNIASISTTVHSPAYGGAKWQTAKNAGCRSAGFRNSGLAYSRHRLGVACAWPPRLSVRSTLPAGRHEHHRASAMHSNHRPAGAHFDIGADSRQGPEDAYPRGFSSLPGPLRPRSNSQRRYQTGKRWGLGRLPSGFRKSLWRARHRELNRPHLYSPAPHTQQAGQFTHANARIRRVGNIEHGKISVFRFLIWSCHGIRGATAISPPPPP